MTYLSKFFFLHSLNVNGLVRAIWTLSVLYFVFESFIYALEIFVWSEVPSKTFDFTKYPLISWVSVVGRIALKLFVNFFWLVVTRLLIEVGIRFLETLAPRVIGAKLEQSESEQ